jgi:hypothetical protein
MEASQWDFVKGLIIWFKNSQWKPLNEILLRDEDIIKTQVSWTLFTKYMQIYYVHKKGGTNTTFILHRAKEDL